MNQKESSNLHEIQSMVMKNMSLLSILRDACDNHMEEQFAADMFYAIKAIYEREADILNAIDLYEMKMKRTSRKSEFVF